MNGIRANFMVMVLPPNPVCKVQLKRSGVIFWLNIHQKMKMAEIFTSYCFLGKLKILHESLS